MKTRLMNTSYQIKDIVIEAIDPENGWANVLKIAHKYDNKDDIIAEIKEKNIGTIYKITEI